MPLDPSLQVAQTQAPVYGSGAAGRAAFSQDVVARLMGLGLPFVPAQLFAAHLARETGWGRAVWDNNFGNIKAYGDWPGSWYVLTDRLGFTDPYRAYDSEDAGLNDVVGLVRDSSRYAGAWQQLLAGDPTWYSTLGVEGYYEGPPDPNQPGVHQPTTWDNVGPAQNEYNQVLTLVQQYVPSTPQAVGGGSGASSQPIGGGSGTASVLGWVLVLGGLGTAAYFGWRAYRRGEFAALGLPAPRSGAATARRPTRPRRAA